MKNKTNILIVLILVKLASCSISKTETNSKSTNFEGEVTFQPEFDIN